MAEDSKRDEEIAYLLTVLISQQDQKPKSKDEVLAIYTDSLETIRGVKRPESGFFGVKKL